MAFERISKISETPDGAFVFAEADHAANAFRVVCSGCPQLQNTPYNSGAGAYRQLAEAHQLTIIEPDWGPSEVLWRVLAAAVR